MLRYEDLIKEIKHRPLKERLSILEIVAQSIKQDVNTGADSQAQSGAKFLKVGEFDTNWWPNSQEIAENELWLAESQKLAEEAGQLWPQGLSSVDAIREDRREL